MKFIDHTGHIFEEQSYVVEPIGYQYSENDYIFWFDSEYGYKLSTNQYYFKPIRALIQFTDEVKEIKNFDIHVDEHSMFKLMGSKTIQELLSKRDSFIGNLELSEDMFVSDLTKDDLLIVDTIQEIDSYYIEREEYLKPNGLQYKNTISFMSDGTPYYHDSQMNQDVVLKKVTREYIVNEEQITDGKTLYEGVLYDVKENKNRFALITFYVVVKSDQEGVWTTNILIEHNSEYTPISVGVELVDECEELIINGNNMGVKLPKQILKAVYNANYYSDYPDERMYSNKLKEYLMNFMKIKGEMGNYRSAVNGLKWFGWGDKISISQLVKTDNEYYAQYIRNNFCADNDNIYTYNNFRVSSLISLCLPTNNEINETQYNYDDEFWGEAKPEFENLFDKMICNVYDETEIKFWRGYFDYTFDELGFKLCALRYYYKKYFLPIHLGVNSVSMEHRCWMNDIKLITRPAVTISQYPIFTNNITGKKDYNIKFPDTDVLLFNHEVHYIDENYCEFGNTKYLGENDLANVYFVNDTLVNIPIKFEQDNDEQYFNCKLILVKDKNIIHEAKFDFVQRKGVQNRDTHFKSFVIHPKTINTILTGNVNEKFNINAWLDSKYVLYLCVNNEWYTYSFTLEVPELQIDLGKLIYKYYLTTSKTFEKLHGKQTLFRQLNGFYKKEVNGKDTDFIDFNAFMYQPDLVSVTNADFIEEIVAFSKANNTTYMDGSKIPTGSFCYYVEYENFKYIFSKDLNTIIKQDSENVLEIINEPNFSFVYEGDGTYSMTFKDKHTKIVNLELKSTIYENLTSYINTYYSDTYNAPDKYKNRVHLINIRNKNFELLPYSDVNAVLGKMILAVSMLGSNDQDKLRVWYTTNHSRYYVEMYKQFFMNNGDSIFDMPMHVTNDLQSKYENKPLNNMFNLTNDLYYDFYLMHDLDYWYGVLISENTIDGMIKQDIEFKFPSDINQLTINNVFEYDEECKPIGLKLDEDGTPIKTYTWGYDDTDKYVGQYFLKIVDNSFDKRTYMEKLKEINKALEHSPETTTDNGYEYEDIPSIESIFHDIYTKSYEHKPLYTKTYYLEYNRSSSDVLVNRLDYESANGINHFEATDFIACTLTNNDKLPFKLMSGSKWSFTPCSINMNDSAKVNSNTEMALISIGAQNSKYEKGYYNITCKYTLDDFIEHSYVKHGKLRVNK